MIEMSINKSYLLTVFLVCLALNGQGTLAYGEGDGDTTIRYKNEGNSVLSMLNNLTQDTVNLTYVAAKAVFNPLLTVPFFWGPIYPDILHVRANTPIGHYKFDYEMANKFSQIARDNSKGLVTFWMGPIPVIYITDNNARRHFVREACMGIVDNDSAAYLRRLFRGNNVMGTFPDFLPINSEEYKAQRRFLMDNFHHDLPNKLSKVEQATSSFLEKYSERGLDKKEVPLRDLVNLLILYTNSSILGLDTKTLDCYYLENQDYRNTLNKVAQYGISKKLDKAFEEKLYQVFEDILKSNFETISKLPEERNLIKNIFTSLNVIFPDKIEDFETVPQKTRHIIAMNFMATGIGGMFHSTANTLDWALACLLNDSNKLNELVQLMENNKDVDLKDPKNFDQGGVLFPIGEYLMQNAFINPPFSHEFFIVCQPITVKWSGNEWKVPGGSLIMVNYLECNRSNEEMTPEHNFCKKLKDENRLTVGTFVMSSDNASFGGSDLIRENNKSGKYPNNKSRKCPGAKFSLYEQMIMMATLLRDYPTLTSNYKVSCDVDPAAFPLHSRKNDGGVVLQRV